MHGPMPVKICSHDIGCEPRDLKRMHWAKSIMYFEQILALCKSLYTRWWFLAYTFKLAPQLVDFSSQTVDSAGGALVGKIVAFYPADSGMRFDEIIVCADPVATEI